MLIYHSTMRLWSQYLPLSLTIHHSRRIDYLHHDAITFVYFFPPLSVHLTGVCFTFFFDN